MKTPYDAANRWKKQVLDDLRRTLAEEYARETKLQQAVADIDENLKVERELSATSPLYSADAFAHRCASEKTELQAKLKNIKPIIETLETDMAAAFQNYKALDIAKERFIAAALAEAARLETLALDDVVSRRRAQ